MKKDMKELFETVVKIINPNMDDDTDFYKRKAIQIFLGFDDYLIDALPGYCEDNCEIDFGAYAAEVISQLEED
jgi:hypothetical protein